MWSRHWETADPKAERELNLRPERFVFKCGNGGNHMEQDPGSREGVAKFECFPRRDALVPALTYVQVHYQEEV